MMNTLDLNFIKYDASKAARTIESFPSQEVVEYLLQLPLEQTARLMIEFIPSFAAECLSLIDKEKVLEIFKRLEGAKSFALYSRLDETKQSYLLDNLPKSKSMIINYLLSYPSDSVGAMMDINVLLLASNTTVKNAILQIKNFSNQPYPWFYVVDEKHILVGMVHFSEILHTGLEQTLSTIMQSCPVVLSARTDIYAVAENPAWLKQEALPVVNRHGMFLGVLPHHKVKIALRDYELTEPKDYLGTLLNATENIWHISNELTSEIDTLLAPGNNNAKQ